MTKVSEPIAPIPAEAGKSASRTTGHISALVSKVEPEVETCRGHANYTATM